MLLGYVFIVVCLSVCLSVCLLATLCKNFWTDLHEIFTEDWQWASKQMVKFWWQSGSRIGVWIQIATLVRCALAEVCTIPVLLVYLCVLFLDQRFSWYHVNSFVDCRLFALNTGVKYFFSLLFHISWIFVHLFVYSLHRSKWW